MTEAPASTRARLAQIAPLDSGGEHPAMGLARHLACTAHYRDALITALPPPAAPSAVNLRNYALAAVHALRTLMYACQNPEVLTPELADQAAREIATAWADGDAGDWTWMHCKALGLDPDEIVGLAEGSARRMAANGAQSNGDGRPVISEGQRAPESAANASGHDTAGDGRTPGMTASASGVRDLADAVIDLGALALAFGRIDRTACFHPDGVTRESDTDHTVMLGWVAPALAARCFPSLNVGLVAQFALIHDMPEVYAGDTPTLRITEEGRRAKAEREAVAAGRLHREFWNRLPWLSFTLALYEDQVLPEARFVRGLDKCLPKVVHLLDGCAGLREVGMGAAELAAVFERQEADMARYVGEFTDLMDLRAELVSRVVALHAATCGAGQETTGQFAPRQPESVAVST